jgi:hypothetical protein
MGIGRHRVWIGVAIFGAFALATVVLGRGRGGERAVDRGRRGLRLSDRLPLCALFMAW